MNQGGHAAPFRGRRVATLDGGGCRLPFDGDAAFFEQLPRFRTDSEPLLPAAAECVPSTGSDGPHPLPSDGASDARAHRSVASRELNEIGGVR